MNKETFALTPEVTIVWPAIFEPESFKGGEEKYRAVLLLDQGADLSTLNAAIVAARNIKFPGKDTAFYKALRYPIRDGGEKALTAEGKPDPESFFYGRRFISVKSNFMPQVVDRFNQPITDPKEIYGGCRVVVLLNFYGYDHLGNRGVSCSMRAIMKTADGGPIGGGKIDTGQVFAGLINTVSPAALIQNDPDLTPVPKNNPFTGKAKGKWKPPEAENLDQYRTKGLDDISY
jgi:hypothetical protein